MHRYAMDFPIFLTGQIREHLRSLRKARGLTQAGLGELLGLGQARIAEIESNPGVVSVDQLMKVVSALQATLVIRDQHVTAGKTTRAGVVTTDLAPAERGPRGPVKSTRSGGNQANLEDAGSIVKATGVFAALNSPGQNRLGVGADRAPPPS